MNITKRKRKEKTNKPLVNLCVISNDKWVENLRARAIMQWIKCSDRLPKEGVLVLTYWKKFNEFRLDYIVDLGTEKIWACVLEDDNRKVTHWKPIEPPKE